MKNEEGQQAGYCSKMVTDRGDRCLFARLIGNWHENSQGAPNTIMLLITANTNADAPYANRISEPMPLGQ
jgi:hypothetical protein